MPYKRKVSPKVKRKSLIDKKMRKPQNITNNNNKAIPEKRIILFGRAYLYLLKIKCN